VPLAPLATVTDLSNRGISDERASMALDVASASIRDAAGSMISAATSTITVPAPSGHLLTLPGPVTAVSSVAIDGYTLPVTDYRVVPNGIWLPYEWSCDRDPAPVTITYTHGLTTVPADIVDLTCQLAIAWINHTAAGGGSTAGLESAAIDDARESYTAEAAGQVSPVFIPDVTRRWLAARFGSGPVVVETR